MLIKLAGHFYENPNHIDKIISIKGLPQEWFFRKSKFGGVELVPPWVPDNEANIPKSIRHLCEEVEITHVFAPIEKGRESVIDKKKVIALKLDFSTGPGRDAWELVERYLDRMTPRDQKVPKPVLCAPNQKSDFNPHEARRTARGSLELGPCEIPEVDLRESIVGPKVSIPEIIVPVEKKVEPKIEEYQCKKCDQKFTELRLLRGHNLRGHKKVVEKIGV
jgi:hypothetical protein